MKHLLMLSILLTSCTTTVRYEEVLACPTPDLYDFTAGKLPWNKQDVAAYERAKVACPEKNIHMPCLTRFVRYKHGEYAAICGAKRKVTLWK